MSIYIFLKLKKETSLNGLSMNVSTKNEKVTQVSFLVVFFIQSLKVNVDVKCLDYGVHLHISVAVLLMQK